MLRFLFDRHRGHLELTCMHTHDISVIIYFMVFDSRISVLFLLGIGLSDSDGLTEHL